MANVFKIAKVTALTERPGTDKIGIRKIPVVDDVCLAAHGAELHQASFSEDLRIDALIALKMKNIFWVVRVPGVAPAVAGTFLETPLSCPIVILFFLRIFHPQDCVLLSLPEQIKK